MIVHGPVVVPEVEVGVAELAVYGGQGPQVVRTRLDGGLEEGDAGATVTGLAQPLPLQCQLQARAGVHLGGGGAGLVGGGAGVMRRGV